VLDLSGNLIELSTLPFYSIPYQYKTLRRKVCLVAFVSTDVLLSR